MKNMTMVWSCPPDYIEKVLNARPPGQEHYFPLVQFIEAEDLMEDVHAEGLFMSFGNEDNY